MLLEKLKSQKRSTLFLLLISSFLLIGVLIPKIFIQDSKQISHDEASCAKFESWIMYDNSIERLLTFQMTAARKQKNEIIEVNAYTLFGIRYATIYVYCGDNTVEVRGAGLIQRRWDKD